MIRLTISSGRDGRPKYQPWARSQPIERSRSAWSAFSTPSAVTVRPRVWASDTRPPTIRQPSTCSRPLSLRSLTNEPAIFRLATGRSRR